MRWKFNKKNYRKLKINFYSSLVIVENVKSPIGWKKCLSKMA